jgi:flagellar biosynthesis anti-sigma factor FlgM
LERIMKIQGTRPDEVTSTSQPQATERTRSGRSDGAAAAPEPQTDRVQVSSDARLAEQAVRAAHEAPDIRPDVVDAARQKLAAGQVGNDVNRLADKLIDSLLG